MGLIVCDIQSAREEAKLVSKARIAAAQVAHYDLSPDTDQASAPVATRLMVIFNSQK